MFYYRSPKEKSFEYDLKHTSSFSFWNRIHHLLKKINTAFALFLVKKDLIPLMLINF